MRSNRRILRKVLSGSIFLALAGCAAIPVNNQQAGNAGLFTPDYTPISNLDIARREFGRGNYGSAIEYLEKELAAKPSSVAALNGLGACYDQLGRYDVAQRYYFRALDMAPDSSQTLSNIGYSYLQQGRHRDAVAILELALQKNGGNQVAANNLELARSGLVEGVELIRMAGAATDTATAKRSTNNGPQDDQVDFMTLLGLLQNSGQDVAAAGSAGNASPSSATEQSRGAAVSVVSVVQSPAPITRMAAVSNAGVLPEEADQQLNDGNYAPTPAQVAVTESVPVVDRVQNPLAEESLDSDELPAFSTTGSMTPVGPGESAALALVTGSTAIATPVLEPVSSPDVDDASGDELARREPLTLTIVDSALPDPARASDNPSLIATLSTPLNVVVENGNGVRGIARATSNWLRGDKLDIKRVGDAGSFDYAQTVIYYRPELAPYAQEIAASLNLSCDLRPSADLAPGADVRVVLGHDFASQVSIENGGLAFEQAPNTDYLRGIVRLEVANGNGVNGMAARVREYLSARGGNVVKISDAENYAYSQTVLYYRSGTRIAAEALAESLPLPSVKLVETDRLRTETDARLVIGSDFVPFDNLVLN
ncbi:MAG: LytR C-terminal domain-containing protein [Gammaproteobacteria bacterium]|nr:LytR C-terminal domain-containing protein [Pseudomonadales bacterium]MCP5348233.1 LytR C-terminal domain-containing protein [Pseudomonadales bacterium]